MSSVTGSRNWMDVPCIARGDVRQVAHELDVDGLIESEPDGELRAPLRGRALAQRRHAGVARHDPRHGEHEEHDGEEDGDADEDAPDDETGHRRSGAPWGSRWIREGRRPWAAPFPVGSLVGLPGGCRYSQGEAGQGRTEPAG